MFASRAKLRGDRLAQESVRVEYTRTTQLMCTISLGRSDSPSIQNVLSASCPSVKQDGRNKPFLHIDCFT